MLGCAGTSTRIAGGLSVRGRPPKPTLIKQAQGNPGKRPLNMREPQPEGELYGAPKWLSETQREGWAFAITNAPPGLLKELDRSVLAIWVVAEDLHREAAEKIALYGMLTKSPNAGLPLQSPYLAILNKQAQIMLKAGAELGFSPASRTRVQVERTGPGRLPWMFNPKDPDNYLGPPPGGWGEGQAPDEFFGD
jgi:P27 family predicted phage terminase small subunit